MTEYVFNAASNDPASTVATEAARLTEIFVQTLAELDAQLGAARPLKLPQNPWDLILARDLNGSELSLGEIINGFYNSGATRDLAAFFDALQCYAPAVEQLEDAEVDAILRLSPSNASRGYEGVYQAICDAGFDAMQCIVTGGTLVSFAHPRWDFDHAVFECGSDRVELDHVSLPKHVDPLIHRRREAARATVSRQNFEAIREAAFPLLTWGRDVPDQVFAFPAEYMTLAFKRLASLDDFVRRWRLSDAIDPPFDGLSFRDESELTMDNYGDQRRFRSASGEMKTYEKHVWIDRGNRIHLILNRETKSIEIGYIGPHLRTWMY